MGLIKPQKFLIKLSTSNVKRLENLGYNVPKYISSNYKGKNWRYDLGSEILVDVNDLAPSSHVKVMCKCDECGKVFDLTYGVYNQCHKNNDVTYCKSCKHLGDRNGNWNNNITYSERIIGRNYPEYKEFIKKVLLRDKYICQCCGKHAEDVHHLDGYNWCIEKRTDVTNGISLCVNCHSNFHSIYGKGNNTKEQFEKWINHSIDLLDNNEEIYSSRKIYCFETNKVYKSSREFCSEVGIKYSSHIYNLCNLNKSCYSFCEYHVMWEDIYRLLDSQQLNDYYERNFRNPNQKKVVCLNTKEIFNNSSIASRTKKCDRHSIIRCCENDIKKTATLSKIDNSYLLWSFYEDYIDLSNEDIDYYLNNYDIPIQIKSVINIYTGKNYKNTMCAEKETGINHTTILCMCKRNLHNSFNFKDEWMFETEYNMLPIDLKKQIISLYDLYKDYLDNYIK